MATLTVTAIKMRFDVNMGDTPDNSPSTAAVQIFYRFGLKGSSTASAVEIPVLLSPEVVRLGQGAIEQQARMHALTVLEGLADSMREPVRDALAAGE